MAPMLRTTRRTLAVLLLCAAAGSSWAQAAYPAKPIRLIVPFAGGNHDGVARAVADKLAEKLGQPVVVDNRGGAAGNIGADLIAKATPDGYTIGVLSSIHTVNSGYFRKLPFDIGHDFTPLAVLGESPVLLVASLQAPFNSFPEMLAYAKAHPGKLNFGSTTSFTIELLKSMTDLDITTVLYKGIGEAQTDLAAGRIDLSAGAAQQVAPLVKAGRFRALAVAGKAPLAEFPGIAPVAQTVPGYDASIWFGLFAPAGLPPAIATRLRGALAAVLALPEVQQRLATLGVDEAGKQLAPEAITERLRSESALWKRVAAKSGSYFD
ncbi:MAG: tripartite tricarboxylate transporter substrate-binding protein [Pseudomonadota bacterium]